MLIVVEIKSQKHKNNMTYVKMFFLITACFVAKFVRINFEIIVQNYKNLVKSESKDFCLFQIHIFNYIAGIFSMMYLFRICNHSNFNVILM